MNHHMRAPFIKRQRLSQKRTCHLPDVIHGLRSAFQQHIRAPRAQRLQSLIRQSHDLALQHNDATLMGTQPWIHRFCHRAAQTPHIRPVSVLPPWECSCQPNTYRNVVSAMAQNSDSATASTADTNLLALQRGGGVLAHEQLDPQFGRRYLDVELACAATT